MVSPGQYVADATEGISSSIIKSLGMAVISFDFESTATCPCVSPCFVARALTTCSGSLRCLAVE